MKKIIILFILTLFLLPSVALAQDPVQETFKAKVLEVVEEKELTRDDGSKTLQQNLKLIGIEGDRKDQEFNFYGINELDVLSSNVYKKGDKVMVLASPDIDGNENFYVTDYIRSGKLLWLIILFCFVIVAIASWKGVKSLISLVLTFVVILYFIVPQILAGFSPLLISIIGSLIILLLIIYITEGFNKKSHISILSILISLVVTGLLTIIFSYIIRLTGSAQEEAMYLIGIGESAINMKGLLLAGIVIGTLGVLDDVVVSQVASVDEIKKANPNLPSFEVFKRAMKIGTSHIGSMTNTLFLAYAGASLPLLLIFSVKQEPFLTFAQIINNEMIATEVTRALIGSIGLALAVPIATGLAAWYLEVEKVRD